MIDPVLNITARTALALLFVLAAAHKWSDRHRFVATFAQYRVVPQGTAPTVAYLVMVCEPVLALGLMQPELYRIAALGVAGLLVAYSGAIAVNLWRGRREIDCGCFGPNDKTTISWWLVARNAALLLVVGATWLPQSTRSLHWVDAITVLAATATLTFLWAASQRLVYNWPGLRRLA